MSITSPDFKEGGLIPKKFTREGENIRPNIQIQDPPEGTKSLVIIMDDPDAPSGTFLHWSVWNIPPDTKEITSDVLPIGAIEGINGRSKIGYTGPYPPSGTHRYIFHLFALERILSIPQNASRDELEKEMTGRIIAKAQLTGLYKRT